VTASQSTSPAPPKKRRQGQRPPDDSWKQDFLAAFALSGVVRTACRQAGIDRHTAYAHRKRDPAFALEWERAEEEATDSLEQVAINWGTTGLPERVTEIRTTVNAAGDTLGVTTTTRDSMARSPYLLSMLLKARRPEKYRERYEVTQSPTSPVGFDYSKLSQKELEAVYDALAKAVVEDVVGVDRPS
jgi:hypothetical protein